MILHLITGQACIASEYIMVDRTIKDKLIIELKKNLLKSFLLKILKIVLPTAE